MDVRKAARPPICQYALRALVLLAGVAQADDQVRGVLAPLGVLTVSARPAE